MRVSGKYFKQSNRALGEYVTTEKPERAEIAPVADLAPVFKNYTGRAAMARHRAAILLRPVEISVPRAVTLVPANRRLASRWASSPATAAKSSCRVTPKNGQPGQRAD